MLFDSVDRQASSNGLRERDAQRARTQVRRHPATGFARALRPIPPALASRERLPWRWIAPWLQGPLFFSCCLQRGGLGCSR